MWGIFRGNVINQPRIVQTPKEWFPPGAFVAGCAVLIVVMGLIVWVLGLPDQILFLGIIPTLYAAYYYSRWAYQTLLFTLSITALAVTYAISDSFSDSIQTIAGSFLGIFIVAEIIYRLASAQRKIAQTLGSQAQEQSALISAIPDLVFRLSSKGVFLSYSTSDLGRLLLPPGEFLDRSIENVLPPHVAQLTIKAIASALENNRPASFEFQIRPGKQNPYYECRIAPINHDEVLAIIREITERKHSEETLARSAGQMALLYQRSLEINAHLDLPDLLMAIPEHAAQLVGARMGALYLMQSGGSRLELVTVYNLPETFIGKALHLGEGAAGRAALTRKPVNIADHRIWEGRAQNYQDSPFCHVLAVPLEVSNRIIGVVNVTDDEEIGLFPEEDIRLVSLFANQAAIAIENARLFTETANRAEQLGTLNRIGLAIVSGLDMDHVLRTIYEQCLLLVPIQAFYLALYDHRTGLLTFPIFFDQGQLVEIPPRKIEIEPGITGYIIQTGQALYVPDLLNPGIALPFPIIQVGGQHARAFLGIPLMLREQVVGVLSIQSYQVNAYDPDAIRLLETIAAQATIAIENARLYGEQQKQAAEVAALYRASARLLNPSSDVVSLARQIAEVVKDELGFVNCGVLLVDEAHSALIRVARYGDYEINSPEMLPLDGSGLSVAAANSGQPVYAPDVRQASGYIASHPDTITELDVPLYARGQVIGILDLQSPQFDAFDERARRMAAAFAERAGLALENARLYEELQRQAIVDELTGIYNYRGLLELGTREFERARRFERPLSVLFFDIDHFREFNNQYSHAIGNVVLHSVAEQARANMRVIDLLTRFGGEEFVILLPETTLSAASLVAERLRQEIEAMRSPTERGELGVTVSIGVAELSADMPDLAALIDRANQAEHRAKEQGRNRVVISSE